MRMSDWSSDVCSSDLAEVEVGNYNKREFQGALNIPIIDDVLAIRLAADIDRRKGFTKNLGPGGNTDDANMDAFRVSVRFQPTDWIRHDLFFDHTRIDTNAQGFYPFQEIGRASSRGRV